jgi:hypothetical protein
MRQLFSNTELDTQFKKEGYVKISLLDTDGIADLKRIVSEITFSFENNVNRERCNYNTTLFEANADKRIELFNKVVERMRSELEKVFIDFDVAMVNYWSKVKNEGPVEMHQNWSHVDETRYCSMSIWIPLQATNRQNGTMEVVPRSQGKYDTIRGINIFNPLVDISQQILENDILSVDLLPGDAVIFDDSLVHYTGPNKTEEPREAIQLVVKPKEAQALFYFRWLEKQEDNIEIFDASVPFFSQLQVKSALTGRPDFGKSLGFTTYHNNPISYDDFKQALRTNTVTA